MKVKSERAKERSPAQVTIGLRGFAQISAVEGLHLTDEMWADFREFDAKRLSNTERRKRIARKYGAPRIDRLFMKRPNSPTPD